jgi:hypothetical protein
MMFLDTLTRPREVADAIEGFLGASQRSLA